MQVQSHILRLCRLNTVLSKNSSWEESIEIYRFSITRVLVCIVRLYRSRCWFEAVEMLGIMETINLVSVWTARSRGGVRRYRRQFSSKQNEKKDIAMDKERKHVSMKNQVREELAQKHYLDLRSPSYLNEVKAIILAGWSNNSRAS